MLWFIIFPVIMAIVLACLLGSMEDDFDAFSVCAGGFFGAALGALLGLIANLIAIIWVHPVWYKSCDIPLQSMGTSSSIHGSFFLGIGSVDSYPTYNYFAKTGPDSYQEGYQYTDSSTVHETNDTPHLVCWSQKSSNNWTGLLSDGGHNDAYDFYVPKGSVVRTYTLKP